VHSLDTKQLTLVAWSVAKLGNAGSHEGALLDAVATSSIQQAEQFSPLVRMHMAAAGLFKNTLVLFAIVVLQIIRVSHHILLQGMANLVWSFGRLHHPADPLVAAIVPQVRLHRAAQLAYHDWIHACEKSSHLFQIQIVIDLTTWSTQMVNSMQSAPKVLPCVAGSTGY
jgi:hypothetical protein